MSPRLAFLVVAATAGFAAEHLTGDRELGRLMVIFSLGTFFASLDTASGSVLRVMDRFGLAFTAVSVS